MQIRLFFGILFFFALSLQVFAQKTKQIKGEAFGDGVKAKKYVTFDDVLKDLDSKDTVKTTMRASISGVCQVKGCWMTVHSPSDNDPEMMVRFKDYGFFMPFDIAGKEVIVEGFAYKSITPVDELKHYAEDAGKSKAEIELITKPREEIKFLASGVILVKS